MNDIRRKVIGLIRVSTKGQAEEDRAGIPRQRGVINQIVACERLDCIKTIEVNDVSGTEIRNCPEIMAILGDLRNHSIHGIVVADFDRFMRPDNLAKIGLLDIFEETKTILYFQGGRVDFSTDNGFMTAGFQALVAGNEIRTFKRRVQGAKEYLRKQGKCPNSAITLPRGVTYNRELEKWQYTDGVAEVQEAFRLVDEEHLTNYRALEHKTGIHHRTLHNILRNPIYIGIRFVDTKRGGEKYLGKDGRQSDRKKVKRQPDEIINIPVIEHPAVDPARFERVQAILGGKKNAWASSRSTPSLRLLTGVGRCGICGSILYSSSNGGRIRQKPGYYICRKNYYLYRNETGGCSMRNIRQDAMDEAVIRWVSDRLSDRSVLKGIITNYLESHQSAFSLTNLTQVDIPKSLASVETKKQRLHRGWLDGRFTDKEHDAMRKELDSEEIRLKSLEERTQNSTTKGDIDRCLSLLLKGAMAFSRIQDRLKQKAIVQQLFAEILIGESGIQGFKIRQQYNAVVCEGGRHTNGASQIADNYAFVCENGSHTRRDSWRQRA